MKNFIAVILTFLYLSLASGANINIHYCGDNVQSISLLNNSEMCCCGIATKESGCCQYENVYLNIDVDQNFVTGSKLINKAFSSQISTVSILEIIESEYDYRITKKNIVPPPKPKPIWLLNCTFTFYG